MDLNLTNNYSINDLKWKSVLEFRSVGTGKFYMTINGKRREETVGKNFVHTKNAGVMELDDWLLMMDEAVKREGLTDMLNRIAHGCRNFAWLHTERDIRQYALECLSDETYRAWDDFKENENAEVSKR